MKKSLALLVLTLASGSVFAAAATTASDVETYRYGMNLDVSHVISTTAVSSSECGIQQRQMVYEDSAGKRHVVAYEGQSSSPLCTGG